MKNKKKFKQKIDKLLEDNKIIKSYLKGEITKEELIEKGVELKMPIKGKIK